MTINITTEKLYRENPINVCTGFRPPECEPTFITAEQLYEVLDSAKDGVGEKFYVLQEPEPERSTCSRCGREPDGISPDNVMFLKCGHTICNECHTSMQRKHPKVKFPSVWCFTCNQSVKSNYA